MKNIVIFDEFNEIDLKPTSLLQKYVRLTKQDVKEILIKKVSLNECFCPGCASKKSKSIFKKFNLKYVECSNCHTIYISPRPDDKQLNLYYSKSKARVFWRDEISKITNKKRKEKIIKPRFQWIVDSTQEYLPEAKSFVDINADQYGYIEEMIQNKLFKKKILVNPFLKLESMKTTDGIIVSNSPWWNTQLKEEVDAVSLFEICDRTADIDLLFTKLKNMLRKNGLLFMTDILISGFDLQTLWENAENLYPPDRLNVFSVEGLRALFQRHGFECLEFSTPGILDVEIVVKTLEKNPKFKLPRFIRYMLQIRNDNLKRAFQEFLQANLLSSYSRVLLRKK